MPTYEYKCRNCGHEFEELQSMNEPPLLLCPSCKTENLVRIMGGGSGLIFKGTGFYLTDYKKTSTSTGSGKPAEDKKTEEKKNSTPEKK